MTCRINDIAYNGTCRRQASRASAIEHCLTKHISFNENSVKRIHNRIKRISGIYHIRCNDSRYLIIAARACSEELYPRAYLSRIFEILRGDLCYSLCINIRMIYLLAVCNRRKYCNLSARIVAFYVCLGIFLGITHILRLFKRRLKRYTVRIHSA